MLELSIQKEIVDEYISNPKAVMSSLAKKHRCSPATIPDILPPLKGVGFPTYGDGKQVRDVLYVRDLIDVFDKFLNSNLKHEVFNIGGGPKNTLSLLELLEMLKWMSGMNPKISFAEWRPADQKVYISNINKAKTLLNWEPKTSLEDGVGRLVNWISNNIRLFK